MTNSLHLIPAAKNDLQGIWRYTVNKWGITQAEHYVSELKDSCHKLMETPLLGKSIPDAGDGVRVYRCQYHYIFYIEEAERVVFLAFMHEKRDMLRHILTRLP